MVTFECIHLLDSNDIFKGHTAKVVVNDTQSDSIQYLNFGKKWFIQYSIQYCCTQDSIQNIIQLKKKSLIQLQESEKGQIF